MSLSPYPMPIAYGHTDAVKNSGGYLINMEAEKAPDDARTPVTLNGSPGLDLFNNTGVDPVLEEIEVGGAGYAVTKGGIYRIFADGGYFKMGTVVLEPQCSIATNGLAIVVTDGKRAFAYTIQADEQLRYDTNAPFVDFAVELTGVPNFHPASTVTFLDGYFIFGRDGTNQFFNSGLYTLTFLSSAFSAAETNPDYVVAVIENQQQLVIVGTKTFEVFYDTGSGDSPFDRIQGAVGDHGTSSPYTVRKRRNTVIWLDQNGTVIQLSGYQPRPISTSAIEDEIGQRDTSTAFAYCYSELGHDYYVLTVGDFTGVYDLTTGLWHQRKDHTYGRHRSNCCMFVYGKNLVGSFANGKIYDMSRAYFDNDGDPLVATMVPGPLETAGRMASFGEIRLKLDVGFGTPLCPDPVIGLEISRDDGETFGNQRTRPLGKVGAKKTVVRWQRNGQALDPRFRFIISDPVKRSMPSQFWMGVP